MRGLLDVSVVILTYNEELHLKRCLDNVTSFAKEIFVIDSFSTDKTLEIANYCCPIKLFEAKQN